MFQGHSAPRSHSAHFRPIPPSLSSTARCVAYLLQRVWKPASEVGDSVSSGGSGRCATTGCRPPASRHCPLPSHPPPNSPGALCDRRLLHRPFGGSLRQKVFKLCFNENQK